MSAVIVFILGFIFLILLWFSSLINKNSSNEVIPTFINSSVETDHEVEIESILLRSISKYLSGFIKPRRKANKTNSFSNALANSTDGLQEYLTVYNSTKVSSFLNEEKDTIFFLTISNEDKVKGRFESKFGEIHMYQADAKKFLIDRQAKVIQPCWNIKLKGRIIGAVSSADKKQLAIFYSLIVGPKISFRIRFFHDFQCISSEALLGSEQEFNNLFESFGTDLTKNKANENSYQGENFFEINERDHHDGSPMFRNFFSQEFDDFSLEGNTPINSMAIKKNTLAYSRNLDYREFYILKRSEEERKWSVSVLGNKIDRTQKQFFNSNSLKFLHDPANDYNLLQVALVITDSQIEFRLNSYQANHTEYTNPEGQNDLDPTLVMAVVVNDEIVNTQYEEFNTDDAVARLRNFMKPALFSSSSLDNSNLLIQFFHNNLVSLNWNQAKETYSLFVVHNHTDKESSIGKITRLASDRNNSNVIFKSDIGDSYVYVHWNKEDLNDEQVVYQTSKNVNLKNMPKSLKSKEPLSLLLETIYDKTVLLVVSQGGELSALDFSHATVSNERQRRWYSFNFSTADIDMTMLLMVLGYAFILPIYFKYSIRRNEGMIEVAERRTNYLRRITEDIMRVVDNMNNQGNNTEAENQRPNENLNNLH